MIVPKLCRGWMAPLYTLLLPFAFESLTVIAPALTGRDIDQNQIGWSVSCQEQFVFKVDARLIVGFQSLIVESQVTGSDIDQDATRFLHGEVDALA